MSDFNPKDKNLSQKQFTEFYYNYIHRRDRVNLAEWILRLLPDDEVMRMVRDE
jgi:hypothetical protein